MKVQINGKEFWIEFQYQQHHAGVEWRHRLTEATTCFIRDGSAPREPLEDAPVLACATVVRYYLDPPNREKARKYALTDALEDLDRVLPCEAETAREGFRQDKERRQRFWEVYLNRKNTNKIVKPEQRGTSQVDVGESAVGTSRAEA